MSDKQQRIEVSITISVSAESVCKAHRKAAVSLIKLQSIVDRGGERVPEVDLSTVSLTFRIRHRRIVSPPLARAI
jgi:hypothetical protein